ncbi:MAG: hypothetical protein ACRDNY_06625 [Gaiellaceae bacterium]
MAKAFSVASWNVEHLGDEGPPERMANVVTFLQRQGGDVQLQTEQEQRDWINSFSDHALLFFEVQEI